MGKIAYIFLFFIMLISCEKNENLPPNPDWLNAKIASLQNSPLPGITINAYKWNEGYYYNVSNLISSCMFCEVYNYSGDLIKWTNDQFKDFIDNGKFIKTVWKK